MWRPTSPNTRASLASWRLVPFPGSGCLAVDRSLIRMRLWRRSVSRREDHERNRQISPPKSPSMHYYVTKSPEPSAHSMEPRRRRSDGNRAFSWRVVYRIRSTAKTDTRSSSTLTCSHPCRCTAYRSRSASLPLTVLVNSEKYRSRKMRRACSILGIPGRQSMLPMSTSLPRLTTVATIFLGSNPLYFCSAPKC